jgi:hypothetical protein
VRRLAGEELSPCRQRRLQFGQRRAAARGDHQFGRLVVDDAGMAAGVEQLARQRPAVKILAAAATNAQRLALEDARAKPLDQFVLASQALQFGKLEVAAMHMHAAELGAAVQRRHALFRIEQALRVEGALDGVEGRSSSLPNWSHIELIFS